MVKARKSTDMTLHGMELNEMKEIFDRHKPARIKCWHGKRYAYLTVDYNIGIEVTLFTEFRPIEEVKQLLRDTKNLTKTRMVENERCDRDGELFESEPYTQEEE